MDKTPEYLEYSRLIAKKLSGTANEEELLKLQQWIDAGKQNRLIYEAFIKNVDIKKSEKEFEAVSSEKVWNNISSKLFIKRKRQLLLNNVIWKVAASVIFLAFVGSAIFYINRIQYQKNRLAEVITPGYDKAFLVTPNGETFDLEKNSDTIVVADNATVFSNKGKKLRQVDSNISQEESKQLSDQYIIVVPKGGMYELELLDGTVVWLNSDSELRFSNTNIGTERRVQLKGEAYFDVAKDKSRPFIVETQNLAVQVLGTQFDVRAYSEDIYQNITLVEGKVQVLLTEDNTTEPIILNPDQQVVYSVKNSQINKRTVNAYNYCGWKDGIFQFNNENMASILNKLSRWYDVAIENENTKLEQIHYTGEIKRFEQLNKILKLLEIGTDIEFEIADQKVIVRNK